MWTLAGLVVPPVTPPAIRDFLRPIHGCPGNSGRPLACNEGRPVLPAANPTHPHFLLSRHDSNTSPLHSSPPLPNDDVRCRPRHAVLTDDRKCLSRWHRQSTESLVEDLKRVTDLQPKHHPPPSCAVLSVAHALSASPNIDSTFTSRTLLALGFLTGFFQLSASIDSCV